MFLCDDTLEVKGTSAGYFFVIETTKFHFILVIAGNAHPISYTNLECTPQSLTSSNVIGSSHLCAFLTVVLSCCYRKFENCCLRLNHPSHFVNVSVISAIATCYWSLCLSPCSDLWELSIGCGHVVTFLLVIILSLNRPLTLLGSQTSHICCLNSWPETCDFIYWFMLSIFACWKYWNLEMLGRIYMKSELSFRFHFQSANNFIKGLKQELKSRENLLSFEK